MYRFRSNLTTYFPTYFNSELSTMERGAEVTSKPVLEGENTLASPSPCEEAIDQHAVVYQVTTEHTVGLTT